MSTQEFRGSLTLTMEGALLVGGYRTPAGFLDAATALDQHGNPVLPAATVKGALREACTLLLAARANEHGDQRTGEPCTNATPCGLCLVCELFGAPGIDAPGVRDGSPEASPVAPGEPLGRESRLFVGDGQLQGSNRRSLKERQSVGIDDQRGAALPEVLFTREVFDSRDARFDVPLAVRATAGALDLLREALPLLTGLGSARSRGLGLIQKAELVPEQDTRPLAVTGTVPTQPAAAGELLEAIFTVFLEEPLRLGQGPPVGTVQRCLDYIPGSTLRGAVATALLQAGLSSSDPVFVEAFSAGRLSFSDAWPQGPSTPDGILPTPAPASLVWCKEREAPDHRAKRGVVQDTLLSYALAERVIAEKGGAVRPAFCPVCGEPLKVAEGLYKPAPLPKRLVTRVCRDTQTGSYLPGMLFTQESIVPSSMARVAFSGTVYGLTQPLLDHLFRLTELRLGGGRSRGQGRVTLRITPSEHLGPKAIAGRRKALIAAAQPLVDAARKAGASRVPHRADMLMPILLRTDLALPEGTPLSSAPQFLWHAIMGQEQPKHPNEMLSVQQREGERSGFSLGKDALRQGQLGPRPLRPVVRAGSAYLLAGPDVAKLKDEDLGRLETEGVGLDKDLGLGRLLFAPSVFLEGIKS